MHYFVLLIVKIRLRNYNYDYLSKFSQRLRLRLGNRLCTHHIIHRIIYIWCIETHYKNNKKFTFLFEKIFQRHILKGLN